MLQMEHIKSDIVTIYNPPLNLEYINSLSFTTVWFRNRGIFKYFVIDLPTAFIDLTNDDGDTEQLDYEKCYEQILNIMLPRQFIYKEKDTEFVLELTLYKNKIGYTVLDFEYYTVFKIYIELLQLNRFNENNFTLCSFLFKKWHTEEDAKKITMKIVNHFKDYGFNPSDSYISLREFLIDDYVDTKPARMIPFTQ